jgi:hypothetical protein
VYEGIQNCTFPRDLYRKWRKGEPGTMSVHEGRPSCTAVRMCEME